METSAEHFLELIKKSRRGKFKIYIGMSAGVGKTYRMLQEAHALLRKGIDVKIGYIETHNRKETHELLDGPQCDPQNGTAGQLLPQQLVFAIRANARRIGEPHRIGEAAASDQQFQTGYRAGGKGDQNRERQHCQNDCGSG